MEAEFSFTTATTLTILVGGSGGLGYGGGNGISPANGAGGGGGSFVVNGTTPLVAAGGGGGGGWGGSGVDGSSGSVGVSGVEGGVGGTNGTGGGVSSLYGGCGGGGGGGGLNGGGGSANCDSGGGGNSFLGGGAGGSGAAQYSCGNGGGGGGGGGGEPYGGGGGGGGYGGGGGGGSGGGGGGSIIDSSAMLVVTELAGVQSGNGEIDIVAVPAPTLTTQPASQTVPIGGNANFNVAASGTPPLAYQWFFNTNTVLSGATNTTLAFGPVMTNQAGIYQVLVTNLYGSATSTPAMLTVQLIPNICCISNCGGGMMTLYLASVPGSTNRLWAGTNLSQWQVIATNTTDANGFFQITDTNAIGCSTMFYRLSSP